MQTETRRSNNKILNSQSFFCLSSLIFKTIIPFLKNLFNFENVEWNVDVTI